MELLDVFGVGMTAAVLAVGWPAGRALSCWVRTGQEPPTWLLAAFGSVVGFSAVLLF